MGGTSWTSQSPAAGHRFFHPGAARDATARDAFLRDACQDDLSLRDDVDALIAAHGDAVFSGKRFSFPMAPSASRLAPGWLVRHRWTAGAGDGEVYRARDTELGWEVADQIFPGAWLADPDSTGSPRQGSAAAGRSQSSARRRD